MTSKLVVDQKLEVVSLVDFFFFNLTHFDSLLCAFYRYFLCGYQEDPKVTIYFKLIPPSIPY